MSSGGTYQANRADEFEFVIPEKVYKKVMYMVDRAGKDEISGFGTVRFNEETGVFTAVDAYLLKQTVSGGSTEMEAAAIARELFLRKEEPGALKWHWHSHVQMGVFWSGTDMNLIRQLGGRGWLLATVFNQHRAYRTAFFQPVELMGRRHDMFVDEIPTRIFDTYAPHLAAKYEKEFEASVKKSKWVSLPKWKGTQSADEVVELRDEDWSEYGFAKGETNKGIYNPFRDSSLKSREEHEFALKEMDDDEIAMLRRRDPDFGRRFHKHTSDGKALRSGTKKEEVLQ